MNAEDLRMIELLGGVHLPEEFDPAAAHKPSTPELRSTLPPLATFSSLANTDEGRIVAEFNLKTKGKIQIELTDVMLLAQSMPYDVRPSIEVALQAIEADKPAQEQIMADMPYRLGLASVA